MFPAFNKYTSPEVLRAILLLINRECIRTEKKETVTIAILFFSVIKVAAAMSE